MNKVMVSIICNTYNHENFVSEALDGFLMQKTDFEYEILIHDDASTDSTQKIIKQYEKEYPEIIKPIYQTENQMSKKKGEVERIQRSRAKGKYIALCEGDDYWITENKLQMQVNYLEEHPECSLCVHASYRVNSNMKKLRRNVRPHKGNKIFTVDEVIEGGGGLFATASFVYPRKLGAERPHFFSIAPVGDYPLAIYLALQGEVFYFDEYMSAYRVMSKGSWSERMLTGGIEKKEDHKRKIEKMLDEINKYSDYEYDDTIKKFQIANYFNFMVEKRDFEELQKEKYREHYISLGFFKKLKLNIKRYLPFIVKMKRSLIKRIQQ